MFFLSFIYTNIIFVVFVFATFSGMLCLGYNLPPVRNRNRILNSAWFLYVVLIIAGYFFLESQYLVGEKQKKDANLRLVHYYTFNLQLLGHENLSTFAPRNSPPRLTLTKLLHKWTNSDPSVYGLYTVRRIPRNIMEYGPDTYGFVLRSFSESHDTASMARVTRVLPADRLLVYLNNEIAIENVQKAFNNVTSIVDDNNPMQLNRWITIFYPIKGRDGIEAVFIAEILDKFQISHAISFILVPYVYISVGYFVIVAGSFVCAAFLKEHQEGKDSERQLREYSKKLEESELRGMEANRRLEDAAANALDISSQKSEFLARISHEIRTPMTVILGFARLLEDCKGYKEQGFTQIESIRTMTKHGQFLLNIVNDTLDYSKIDAEKMAVDNISFTPKQIVEEIHRKFQMAANAKHLKLGVCFLSPYPSIVYSDPHLITKILVNLVGNAIKFTPAGAVVVTCSFERVSERSYLKFEVKDSGEQISEDHRKSLFTPFAMADMSFSRKHGGTGLGLTISKRIAALLGGDIIHKRAVGEGNIFVLTVCVRLPDEMTVQTKKSVSHFGTSLTSTGSASMKFSESGKHVLPPIPVRQKKAPASSLTPYRPQNDAQPLAGKRVLVAEDGIDNQRFISIALQKAGAIVDIAENGEIAIEMAMADGINYNIVFMDISMPILDGHEATRRLRELGYEGPIVALTAYDVSDDRDKNESSGFNDFLTKPVSKTDLIEAVKRF